MNRNVLLFASVCLTASVLLICFHRPAAGRGEPVTTASTVQATDDSPAVSETPVAAAPKPVAPDTETNSVRPAAAETAAADANEAEAKTAPEKDKYELLRDLSAWAAKDPEAALAETMKLPYGEERAEALAAVCYGVAEIDPAAAVKLAEDLHLDEQPAVVEDLVQQWASTDLISSLAWAGTQPAGATRDEATTRIAYVMSQTDPSDAATLVMNQIPAGPARDEAIMTVLHQWANQDMNSAVGWANNVAATGPLQQRILNELNGILDYKQALGRQ